MVQNAPTPRTTAILVAVLAIVAAKPAHALMESQEGNAPLSPANYTDWPGVADVVNDQSRVFHVWVNGNEENYYRGDTTALTRALRAFAATAIEERVVILRPGRGDLSQPVAGSRFFDWKLNLIGGIARSLHEEEDAELVWENHPTITVYVGGGVDLASLGIPKGITQLVGVDELRGRYLRGIRSASVGVRRYAAHRLAEVDPYGATSAAAVAELSKDERLRSAAERALAEFKKRADDSEEVRARHMADVRRIRQFVFDWRYRWLKLGLGLLVVAAGVLLAVTLVAATVRRARRRRGADGLPRGDAVVAPLDVHTEHPGKQ